MWSKVGILLFVGIVAATNPAWLPETEYTYSVRSRSLTSLDFDDNYSGVFYRAKLSIKTGKWGSVGQRITARLQDVEISKQHNITLPDGWESFVQLSHYEKLPITEQPFHIHIKDSVITGIEVTSKMPKWEANLIRGVVSQLQLQIEPKSGCSYNVMEQTVTGEYDTVYEFCGTQKSKDYPIYVTKTKNFEVSANHPSIHYGFGDFPSMGQIQPNTNQMGRFFSRSSVSNVKIMGQLHRYNISTAETVNVVSVSPTLTNNKRAVIGSKVNVTLEKRTTSTQEYPKPQSPIVISIVYEQDTPFDQDSPVSKDQIQYTERKPVPLSQSFAGSADYFQPRGNKPHIFQGFIPYARDSYEKLGQKVDLVAETAKLSKEIAQELQHVEKIPQKQSLSRYLILCHLTTLMSQSQMKEVSQKLYTKQEQGLERATWQVWRDSVADAGTYHAFVVIKDWILNNQIEGKEASQVIATVVESVSVPTREFVNAVVEFTKDSSLLKKRYVNDTALLTCGTMMRRVLMNSISPAYSFGDANSKNDEEHVINYVKHLTEKLHHAIQDEDNHRMNVYIRALGNIGHRNILESFEPFWSKEDAPLFQRVQTILALDEHVKIYPSLSSEVLFRIYNSQQLPQVMRVAAVYQIIKTNPSKTVLQQMARNTNTDEHEYVNSAVQSIIREAAELTSEEFEELAKNAASALHLLTEKVYGHQYSKGYFSDYIARNVAYMTDAQVFGSMDSFIPHAIKSKFYGFLGGIQQTMFDVDAMTSSVDKLLNFFKLRKIGEGKQSASDDSFGWSTGDSDDDQLQGLLRYRFGGIESIVSFDNVSILAAIREFEQEYKNKPLQMSKLINNDNLFLCAPLESGSFYTFSMDAPTYLSYNGKVSFNTQPSLSNGEEIQKVKQINVKSDAHMVVSKKIESRLNIITVYDHHTYSAGFDKNWQVYVPLKISFRGDVQKSKYETEIEPTKEGDFRFFHYSTWPVLCHSNIYDLRPCNDQDDSYTVIASPVYNHQSTYFKQSGIAVRLNTSSEHPITWARLYEKFRKDGLVPFFMSLFHSEEIDYTQFDLSYLADESIARKIKIEGEATELTEDHIASITEKTGKPVETDKWVDRTVYNVRVNMNGKQPIDYYLQFGSYEDSVRTHRTMFASYRKQSEIPSIKPYRAFAYGTINLPHVPQIMYRQVYDMELKADGYYSVCIGETCESSVKGPIHFRRSEERKDYLKKIDETMHCYTSEVSRHEPKRQISPCDNMTDIAGLLDHFDATLTHENSGMLLETISRAYDVASVVFDFYPVPFFRKEVKQIQGRFSPDFTSVNVTSLTSNGHYSVNFIPIEAWSERVFVVHPRYHVETRIFGKYLETRTYEPVCVVGPVHITTFDDRTYEVKYEDKQWYLVTYYNETFSQSPDEDKQIAYTVLSRKVGEAKEVKVKVMHPKTGSEIATVELMPVGSFKPTIKINGQQQKWNTTEAGTYYHHLIRFYGNTANEIKVEVGRDLDVIYNGQTFRVAAKSDKLRGGLRGLCGNFDGNMYTDEMTPIECLAESTKTFVNSYKYPINEGQLHKSHCAEEERETAEHLLSGLHVEQPNTGFRKFNPKIAHTTYIREY